VVLCRRVLIEASTPSRHTPLAIATVRVPNNLCPMAEAVSKESVTARLADVRESLTLLADYL
jgi:hypothetical protein